jgi:hypothetical protein
MVLSKINQNLSNLKLIFCQNNIEKFKQFCNSITLLHANVHKLLMGDNNSNNIAK